MNLLLSTFLKVPGGHLKKTHGNSPRVVHTAALGMCKMSFVTFYREGCSDCKERDCQQQVNQQPTREGPRQTLPNILKMPYFYLFRDLSQAVWILLSLGLLPILPSS